MTDKLYNILVLLMTGLATAGLICGCGSSNKEGANVISTIPPSTDGNLQSQITAVTVGSPPVVTFTLYDEIGNPLEPTAFVANGGTLRFTIAEIQSDGNYKNYILNSVGQPTFDSGGVFATVRPGVYTYTFKTDITASNMFDPTRTHTVAAQIERNITSIVGKGYQQAVNPYLDFRPDGQPVTITREVVAISNCNECHGNLGLHGGGRREVALCILCHNPGVIDPDTGNSIDFKNLIHKIHYGDALPSNVAGGNFTIIGFQGSVNSYGDVTYPFISGDNSISGTPVKCVKCHRPGKDLAGRDFGKDVDKYKTAPTREKCTTCHDLTTFDGSTTIVVKNVTTPITVPAVPHTGGPQSSDSACGGCHPSTGSEFGQSITGAHTVVEESSVFTGINFKILAVANATPGNKATVTFKVTDNSGGVISPASPSSFSLKLGYPTVDYRNNLMENYGQPLSQSLASATANGDGSFTITFSKAIPANAAGVAVVGIEGRRPYTISSIHKGTKSVNIGGQAMQFYVDLATGSQATDPGLERRRSVDVNKCIGCHERLSLHGANRVNSIEECVICHNADATDKGQRPSDPTTTPDGLKERPIDFKQMIHKIHTGDELNVEPYVIYGFGGSVNDFSGVTFPRDRRDCLGCHIDATPKTFGFPLKPGVMGTTVDTGAIPNDDSDNVRIQPMTSVCTSCHDSANTATHAADKTSGGVEACLTCHTSGLLLGPDFAHFGDHRFPPGN
ncbi:MAG: OmcA/MtrC family decaheme c-type cytochrome [Nitrospirae bacterium]|nr:OmcA/MtrC family decaheme c-type cytochrome [Nitrospirota bacterium]